MTRPYPIPSFPMRPCNICSQMFAIISCRMLSVLTYQNNKIISLETTRQDNKDSFYVDKLSWPNKNDLYWGCYQGYFYPRVGLHPGPLTATPVRPKHSLPYVNPLRMSVKLYCRLCLRLLGVYVLIRNSSLFAP